jgi:hypothetical protein
MDLQMKSLVGAALLVLLVGCASPIPFNTISIGGVPTVTTTKVAELRLRTGSVKAASGSMLLPAGGAFVSVPTGPLVALAFGEKDQQEFVEQLRVELLRLRVFRAVERSASPAAADLKIEVHFLETAHRELNQEYSIDATLRMSSASAAPVERVFRVNSNEGASIFEKLNTTAAEGKAKAVRRLLERLIPEIQAYARDA